MRSSEKKSNKTENAAHRNNSKTIKESEKSKEIKYLTLDEWKSVIKAASNERDRLILELLYKTGCTVNELVNMKISDIDFEDSSVTIRGESSRNHESRISYLPSKLTLRIRKFLEKEGRLRGEDEKAGREDGKSQIMPSENRDSYLFNTRQSSRMTTKRIRQLVQLYTKKAGITGKNNPQILRYTHIVHAFMNKIPISAIQKQVGLKRSRAIEIFTELKLESEEDAYRRFLK